MKQSFKTKVLIALLTIAALATGQTAWAADTYSVRGEEDGSTYKFIISRSGNTGVAETVRYRTVSLSAIEGKHFTAKSGTVEFPANETSVTVEVEELTPSIESNAHYMCQESNTRTYRFEVLDLNGFLLAYKDRSKYIGVKVTSPYETKTVTVFDTETQFSDKGYDKNTRTLVAKYHYFEQAAPQAYFQKTEAELRMTLEFEAKEEADGYQYLQILFDELSSCDNRQGCSNGDPGNPNLSRYMAGFEHYAGGKNTTYYKYSFPLTDYDDNCDRVNGAWNNNLYHNSVGDLTNQKFKTNFRANDGRLIVPTDFNNLVVRFNASGSGTFDNDEWYAKNVKAKIQAIDSKKPTIIGNTNYVISAGPYNVGTTVYISIPFSEIVVVDDNAMPTLETLSWGNFTYIEGSGSNVLTFAGTIPYSDNKLQIYRLTGTVKDLSGNTFSFNANNKITYDNIVPNKALTLDGLTLLEANTYAIDDRNDLHTLATYVNCGRNTCDELTFRQTKDITCDANFSPIGNGDNRFGYGAFVGTYDGQGFAISGITVNNPNGENIGLFGYVGTTENHRATIQNVVLRNCTFIGKRHVGAIAGYSVAAYYNNCCVESTVTVQAGSDGASELGGIAGCAYGIYGRITGCRSAAKVLKNGKQNTSKFGGIAGTAGNGDIINCFYNGTSSDVTADEYVGAIIGNREGTIIYNTYHTANGLGAVNGADIIPSGENIDSQQAASYGYTISGGENVSVEVAVVKIGTVEGELLNYAASGLTAYNRYHNTALLYTHDDTQRLYCGANQNVHLTLGYTGNDVPVGYYCSYTVQNANNEDITATALSGSTLTMPASNVTIGHTFIGNPYTVSFNKNAADATGEMADQAFVYDVSKTLTANTFSRAGYDFAGWSLTPDGDVAYANEGSVSNLTTESGATVILYAKWTTTSWAGDGTEGNPYKIQYPSQLDLLASNVNSGVSDYENKYFKQTANLTYDGTENNYTPIGKSSHYFRGHYDGGGYTISGININSIGNDIGVFGYVYFPGTVENVTLANSTIKGFTDVGGIIGYLYGDQYNPDVSNCRVESDVTIGAGTSSAPNHGGIVGRMRCGIISGCFSAATITDNELSNCKDFGGIVGYLESVTHVKDCLFTGSIVTMSSQKGAIVATKVDGSALTNNYYTASNLGGANDSDVDGARRARAITKGPGLVIEGGTETAYSLSGITAIGTSMLQYDGTLYSGAGQTLTINHTDRTGYTFGGYSVKNANDEDITTTALNGTTLTIPASDITVSCIWEAIPWAGEGTEEKPYLIEYPSQLDLLASNVNSGNKYTDTYFKQTADLTYDGTENNYTPIGISYTVYFSGKYDGGGYTISGINVNKPNETNIGLFGYIQSGATIENVTITNCTFIGNYNVGGVIAIMDDGNIATISNCRVENTEISGVENVGGIGGRIWSGCSISNCRVLSTTINGQTSVGGIAGFNYGTISGCVSDAAITYNGQPGGYYFGGIVGWKASSTVKDCLYTGTTIGGRTNIGAIVGNSTGTINPTYTNNYYTNADINLGGVDGNDCAGSRRGYSITFGEGIGISGEKTEYDVSGLTAYGENALEYNGVIYSGATQTVPLCHGELEGKTFTGYTSNDVGISSENTFSMPAKNVAISGDWTQLNHVTIAMNTLGIRTYASNYALDFSQVEGLTAYYASAFTSNDANGTGTLTLTPAGAVPDGEGLMLKGTADTEFEVPIITSADALSPGNLLVGLKEATEVSKKQTIGSDEYTTFILANAYDVIDWYLLAEDKYTLKANSAYLRLKSSDVYGPDGARQIMMDFAEATGISDASRLNESGNKWYTLDGVTLDQQPTRKGLYIRDGKKVVVK